MNTTIRLLLQLWCVAGAAGFAYGCSGAARDDRTSDALPENTGAIVARLTSVPSDVQCVEIQTSDLRTPDVRVDVTPGSSTEIRIAPLTPGSLWLSGTAYSVPCYETQYASDGGPQSFATWLADSTYIFITAGQTTHADLHFHQLGSAEIDVDFDDCDGGSFDSFGCGAVDAGPDSDPPPAYDAGGAFSAKAKP